MVIRTSVILLLLYLRYQNPLFSNNCNSYKKGQPKVRLFLDNLVKTTTISDLYPLYFRNPFHRICSLGLLLYKQRKQNEIKS